jgi:hypothetical protein
MIKYIIYGFISIFILTLFLQRIEWFRNVLNKYLNNRIGQKEDCQEGLEIYLNK